MNKSLCGKKPCPEVCARVCHCPAGLARSREQFAMYRNRREIFGLETSPTAPLTPEYQAQVRFKSQARHNFGAWNMPQRKRRSIFLPTHNFHQQAPAGSRVLKQFASWAVLTGLLAFIGIVTLLGEVIFG